MIRILVLEECSGALFHSSFHSLGSRCLAWFSAYRTVSLSRTNHLWFDSIMGLLSLMLKNTAYYSRSKCSETDSAAGYAVIKWIIEHRTLLLSSWQAQDGALPQARCPHCGVCVRSHHLLPCRSPALQTKEWWWDKKSCLYLKISRFLSGLSGSNFLIYWYLSLCFLLLSF